MGERNIVICDECLCLSVCLSVFLSVCIFQKPHVQTLIIYQCMLPVAVAQSSSGCVAMCCMSVLWMTSYFLIMVAMVQATQVWCKLNWLICWQHWTEGVEFDTVSG